MTELNHDSVHLTLQGSAAISEKLLPEYLKALEIERERIIARNAILDEVIAKIDSLVHPDGQGEANRFFRKLVAGMKATASEPTAPTPAETTATHAPTAGQSRSAPPSESGTHPAHCAGEYCPGTNDAPKTEAQTSPGQQAGNQPEAAKRDQSQAPGHGVEDGGRSA